jgi:hypothetical protein
MQPVSFRGKGCWEATFQIFNWISLRVGYHHLQPCNPSNRDAGEAMISVSVPLASFRQDFQYEYQTSRSINFLITPTLLSYSSSAKILLT